MANFNYNFGSFDSTTVTVEATTECGREILAALFGGGCVSVELPKSRAADFAEYEARITGAKELQIELGY